MVYHFQDLTTEQKAQRRDLLDWYGLVAQLSVLAPLLAPQLYFFAMWTKKRWENANELETPSSPYAKARGEGTNKDTLSFMRRIQNGVSRVVWWSGDSVDVLGYHLGAKGDVMFAACWACWLLFLCFPQTGEGKSVLLYCIVRLLREKGKEGKEKSQYASLTLRIHESYLILILNLVP